jgi:hypothetical protein
MLHPSKKLADFEAAYARERLGALSFGEALRIFEGLWVQARTLNPHFPRDWRDDIAPDIEVARAVNGLPPKP